MRIRYVLLSAVIAIAAVAAVAFFWVTSASTLEASDLPDHQPDVKHGEYVFWAAGCTSCHAKPKGDDPTLLSGGAELETPYGVFRVPNISPDPEHGIGGWSMAQFVNAVMNGTAPGGEHLYPAFPYASYHRMQVEDVMDLKGFLDTLPPSDNDVGPSVLGFPYNIRRGIGLWKWRYLGQGPIVKDLPDEPGVGRGQYLAEAVAHCGECHTPRDGAGGMIKALWLAGAPNPEGKGRVPNITPSPDGIKDWSKADISYALQSGFTPDFDSLGGSMAEVVRNLSHLTDEDRNAIADYLKAIPALSDTGEKE